MDIIKSLNINIWGKVFSLSVEYMCYEGEIITEEQIDAVKRFIAHNKEWVENSKIKVEEFCKTDVMADDDNHSKDDIFSYITPTCLFAAREEYHYRVAIMCDYRYDEEHGLAIVFDSDGTVIVNIQDIIL